MTLLCVCSCLVLVVVVVVVVVVVCVLQSPELLHLPRVVKVFEIYTFTHLKSAIMNKVLYTHNIYTHT